MTEQTKPCSKCKLDKEFSEFNKCAKAKFGLHNHCKLCQKQTRRKWYLKNRDSEISKRKEYSKTEKSKLLTKKHYEANRDKILERNRIRRKTPRARAMANTARNKRYREDPSFRMSVNTRSRMRAALKGLNKSESTMSLLGCSLDELKSHLESKFQPGMSWDNYCYRGWHIDHIIPCDHFDLTKEEEIRKCFHYTNLQPLWWKENLSKNNRLPNIS